VLYAKTIAIPIPPHTGKGGGRGSVNNNS